LSAVLAAEVVLGLLGLGLILALVRALRGPSLADRVVVLDLVGLIAIGFIAAAAVITNQPLLLDVALIVALIAFLGTVAFAHYIEEGEE
jgi:multicomponent Na+:H+ antiporter subunit F